MAIRMGQLDEEKEENVAMELEMNMETLHKLSSRHLAWSSGLHGQVRWPTFENKARKPRRAT
ncbi:hypothetical protein E4U55_005140 [Claviceps digitariae]|nr:hypothetical protein E4U55_005140 [Claviceps digitariae]